MNQQFQTLHLREDLDEIGTALDEKAIQHLVKYCQSNPGTAEMLVKAIGVGISEDGTGTSAVAPTLEPVRVKRMEEDAPMLAHGEADISTYINDKFTRAPRGHEKVTGVEVRDLWAEDTIQENYNRFKKETRIRPKQDQYHEAIKAVNKKLDEVNRILEFTHRMKNELSEGEGMLEVKTRTAKTMDKLKTKIAEAYKKLKDLN